MSDISEELRKYLEKDGYIGLRRLPTGELAAVKQMMFTYGLVVGIDKISWRTRFCYERALDALTALDTWDGQGWPPGYWLKQKPEEVHGPGSKVPAEFRERSYDDA